MAKIRLNDRAVHRALPATGQVELWDDLVPGFGLRIAAGGARTYFVMKRLRGKLVRRTVGKVAPFDLGPGGALAEDELSLPDAREKARTMLVALARGVDPTPAKPSAAAPPPPGSLNTFGEVAAAYFKDPAKRGGARLKSRTELERKVKVDLAAWKDRPIAEITKADIKALIAAKRAKSAVSANRLLALVKRILGWAAVEDVIPANPAAHIEPTDEQQRDRVLTLTELARVWAGAEAMGYPFGPLIQALILTAQRRSEVAGMRRSEIDGAAWLLPDDRTKRGKGHMVPLSPRAVAILGSLPKMGTSSLVFTSGKRAAKKDQKVDRKAPPVAVSGWSRMKDRLDRIIAEAPAVAARKSPDEPLDPDKIDPLAPWTLHDLRRSVATHLRSEGVDRLTISKILNHAEGGMTQIYDRYSSDPEKRAALEQWATKIERLCGLNVIEMKGKRA